MSLYNIVNGVKPATFYILPMLGKHPDEYPRFRDCFLGDEEHHEYNDMIHVYTRVGGANREYWSKQIEKLRLMPGFVADFDDSFDNTFASFVFDVPSQFVNDYNMILSGRIKETSQEYRDILYKVFPNLASKFDAIFSDDDE